MENKAFLDANNNAISATSNNGMDKRVAQTMLSHASNHSYGHAHLHTHIHNYTHARNNHTQFYSYNQQPGREGSEANGNAVGEETLPRVISNPHDLAPSAITNPPDACNDHYGLDAGVPYTANAIDAAATIFTPSSQHAPYIQQAYPLNHLPSVNLNVNMPTYTGITPQADHSLDILSAEQYDGTTIAQSIETDLRQQQPQKSQIQVFGITGSVEPHERSTAQGHKEADTQRSLSGDRGRGKRRRKNMKISDEEQADGDDRSKRIRGRPRLDTKDETAADRRRTQIRMAQRAYRHRKETTISSLEKQLQELQGVNEEMSNIFLNLHDFAIAKGLFQREPEFGSQLSSTTARFLALAKSLVSDEDSKEGSPSVDGGKHGHSDADLSPYHPMQSQIITPQETRPENPAPVETTIWGYQISHQLDEQTSQVGLDQQNSLSSTHQEDRQIISRATFDNASFSSDYLGDLSQYHVDVPDVPNNFLDLFNSLETLPPVETLSQHETSFSRHLQRAALEGGYRLINSKNSPPSRMNEVFGFCLRFETREGITKRLKKMLDATSKDPLYNWRTPFVHLGGAGTYYPLDEDISGTLTPQFRSGMSMGPFSPSVISTRENVMENDFRIKLPGFEGEFFDTNDVENYLRGRGIEIPPNAEFITINLDILSINDTPSPLTARSEGGYSTEYSPMTPASPESHRISFGISQFASSTSIDTSATLDFPTDLADWSAKLSGNPLDLTGPVFNSVPVPQPSGAECLVVERPNQEARAVTLSVTALVEELLKHVVCLGRGAGFRPSDIDSAIVRAVRKSV